MKKFVLDFVRRGLIACGFGPMALAVLYLILQQAGEVVTLTVPQVCVGIFTLAVLAFVAGGMNAIYQIEQLPLLVAIFLHGCVLYLSYLATYLLNDWLEWGAAPILVFTGIFVFGYLLIWAVIYCVVKKNTAKLNAALKKKRENMDNG